MCTHKINTNYTSTVHINEGSNGTDMASSLEPGAIVGIVIVLLVVLVMGVAVAVVMALFLMRRRKTGPGGKHSTARNDIGMGKHLHEIFVHITVYHDSINSSSI